MHLGDERHYGFQRLAVEDICRRDSRLSNDSHTAMRLFMWHPDQKGVASCLVQTPWLNIRGSGPDFLLRPISLAGCKDKV